MGTIDKSDRRHTEVVLSIYSLKEARNFRIILELHISFRFPNFLEATLKSKQFVTLVPRYWKKPLIRRTVPSKRKKDKEKKRGENTLTLI